MFKLKFLLLFIFILSSCDDDNKAEPICGDGKINLSNENCDGEDFGENSCESLGKYSEGSLVCSSSCGAISTDLCFQCGDGTMQTNFGEECDGEDFGTDSCISRGFYEGELVCSTHCQKYSYCSKYCGDNVLDTEYGEVCDLTHFAPGIVDCGDQGFAGGALGCNQDCSGADFSGCDGWIKIESGGNHTCAIDENHFLWCTGNNDYGQLGLGHTISQSKFTKVTQITGIYNLSLGMNHTCVLTGLNNLYCWGDNTYGQLGIGSTDSSSLTPEWVKGSLNWQFVQVGAGDNHTCAIKEELDSPVYCWGDNADGRVGNPPLLGNIIRGPVSVCVDTECLGTYKNIKMVACGGRHSCLIDDSSEIYCWGSNSNGQLGNPDVPSFAPFPYPVVELFGETFIKDGTFVTLGENSTCSLNNNGDVYCWGDNTDGKLGITTDGTIPSQVCLNENCLTFLNAKNISSGGNFVCANDFLDNFYCWGMDDYGQIGDGTPLENRNFPTLLSNSEFTQFSSGINHICSVNNDMSMWCWGKGNDGQVGDGSSIDRNSPVSIRSN
jgi:alpha-tubulin suppressor-like RCC1 family protein